MTENRARLDALHKLLKSNPSDTRALFGLAAEYEKMGEWADVASTLTQYIEAADDQGNGWGRLGFALRKLGREDAARAAYEHGIQAARRHGHPSMAAEFEEVLENWDDTVD